MKNLFKLLIISFAMLLGNFANAQVVTMTTAGSPVTNTGTATSTLAVKSISDMVSIQSVFTKTSGTLGGTATLQASLDGVNYATIATAGTVAGASTYTVTDVATQSVIFTVKNQGYLYYRVSWTGTGTMVGTLASYLIVK
jgi:hypothetical protein